MHQQYQRIIGAETIVICVHGIQGSPSQFTWLTERLPEEIDYLFPLLPGHGAGVKDFARVGSREWIDSIRNSILKISGKYKKVIYVGHSMGCLLGILAAAKGHFSPGAMLLLACPLSLRPTLRYAINNWKAVTQKSPSNPWVKAARDANSVSAGHPFAYLMCAKPYLGLLKLISMARSVVSDLHVPIIALHSEKDEIVSSKSLALLKNRAHAETFILPESGHFLYSQPAKEQIFQKLTSLIHTAAPRL